MPTDPESLRQRKPLLPNDATINNLPKVPRHPLQLFKITAICLGSLWFLNEKKLFHNILHSPKISHTWFKFGLAMSIAIIAIKGYMEIYEGKINKKKIDYKTYPNCTHAVLLLGIATNIVFSIALWPLYGSFSLWMILVFGFGVVLQIMLIVPVWGQNIVSVVALMYFLQEYK